MPVMSKVERAFCRSAPWRSFTGRIVLPWVLGDTQLHTVVSLLMLHHVVGTVARFSATAAARVPHPALESRP